MSAFAEFLILPLSLLAPPQFTLPLDCEPGTTCFIQNHFDHDAGPGIQDRGCGQLTYNGHQGTDFRLRTLTDMAAKVPVLAAADGVVTTSRDGMPDTSIRVRRAPEGQEAGNGVLLTHDNGWSSRYSHLMQGSVRVKPGQEVRAGDVLGYVGLSGNTEFPHVDFTVLYKGNPVDPFAPEGLGSDCTPQGTLWAPSIRKKLSYQPVALLQAGASSHLLTSPQVESGNQLHRAFPSGQKQIRAYFHVIGIQVGDIEFVSLRDASDKVLGSETTTLRQRQAVHLVSMGGNPAGRSWPDGTYTAEYRLERNGNVILQGSFPITVGTQR